MTSYFRHDAGLQERNKRIRVRHANALVFWITSDATVLNARIDKRAEQMVTRGLKDEIRQFMDKYGPDGFDRKQFAAIGLKQTASAGEKGDEAESRLNFARSQDMHGTFNPHATEERPSLKLLSIGLERVTADVESIKESVEQIKQALEIKKA